MRVRFHAAWRAASGGMRDDQRVTVAPFSTRRAAKAMVCTVDGLAAGTGLAALQAGGCAVDAAIAAGAVLAVTHQHLCGLGGDLLALVHREGGDRPYALNASGRTGAGADPARLRATGHRQMPATGEVASVPLPGCVDGWIALHDRFGRLPLAELLEPARGYAANGFAASEALAAASRQLEGVTAAEDFTTPAPLRAGQLVRRPGVGRALEAIVRDGRRGFYEGEFGMALIELGCGEYAPADLARAQAEWVEPLAVDAFGRRLWSLPPNSQGYLLLASAAIASGLPLPDPEDPGWPHLLIEASREAARDRGLVWHQDSDGQALIAEERIAAMRRRVSRAYAGRAAQAAVPGGTVSLCVVDGERTAVSLLQSNFVGWGAKLFVPGLGIALHNRGSSFSLDSGHAGEYGPGRRPPHTLTPAVTTGKEGSLDAVLASRGGEIQPQVLLQLLARTYLSDQSPADAVAAARWALAGDQVLLEGHAGGRWLDGLIARGHRVLRRPSFDEAFGQAQLIVWAGDHLEGASDPRSSAWATAVL
jgi:gamma-glutamyltranspeptidase/glutathione hydrolase